MLQIRCCSCFRLRLLLFAFTPYALTHSHTHTYSDADAAAVAQLCFVAANAANAAPAPAHSRQRQIFAHRLFGSVLNIIIACNLDRINIYCTHTQTGAQVNKERSLHNMKWTEARPKQQASFFFLTALHILFLAFCFLLSLNLL